LRSQSRLSDNGGVNEQNNIEITVNGETHTIGSGSSISELVTSLDLTAGRLAVELNLSIVPRSAWAETTLQPGDKLEIVHFVGGG